MPKSPFFYVNGMNDTLDDALTKMKSYNRRYLRDMGTVLDAERGLLSRENLNKYSIKELKTMVNQRIKQKGLLDPNKGGKLPIKCKDGKIRYYKPGPWSETMSRTRSRALQEEGLHNQMKNAGFDLVQISIGGSGDPCSNWEGSILSITGETPGYPTVDEAQGSGDIFHPRCFIDPQIPIFTSKGWKEIGTIKIGDLVLTHKGKFKRVTNIIVGSEKKNTNVIRIALKTGIKYKGNKKKLPLMTFGHPILTEDGWKKIEDITSKDKIAFLAKRCPGCNKLIPAWLNYCCSSCRSSYHAKKNWKKGVYKNIHEKQSKTLKALYVSGKIDKFAITKNANKKTREMVENKTHNFFNPEIIKKGHKKLGQLKYATYIERKIRWLLDQMGINYTHTFEFKRKVKFKNGNNRRYFIDIVIPDKKIAIECDGYFHSKQKDYDRKRQLEIEKEGWTFIRFTDNQIRNNLKSCKDEIKRVLKNHNNEYEFIYLPIENTTIHTLKKGVKTYNISVEDDESYIARWMVSHNCVHSTSPFILTEDESGPRVWGRDDLTPRVQAQLKEAGVTKKGVIKTGVKTFIGDHKKPLNMKSTALVKTHKEAMKRAEKLIADNAIFSKTMSIDGLNDAIFALEESIKRFPAGPKMSYVGLKDKLSATLGPQYRVRMGSRTTALFVKYTKPKDMNMILFRKGAMDDAYVRKVYKESAEHIQKKWGNYQYNKLKLMGVKDEVIDVLKKQNARHWALGSELGGTKGVVYHEYGHKLYYLHANNAQLKSLVAKSYKDGWRYVLGEYACTNSKEYFSEVFSMFMQGHTSLLDPELVDWLNKNSL